MSDEVALCLGCGGVSPGDIPKVSRQLGGVMFKGQNVNNETRTRVSVWSCVCFQHTESYLKKVIIFPTGSCNEEFYSSQ